MENAGYRLLLYIPPMPVSTWGPGVHTSLRVYMSRSVSNTSVATESARISSFFSGVASGCDGKRKLFAFYYENVTFQAGALVQDEAAPPNRMLPAGAPSPTQSHR